jgi:hypothetical protein
MNGDEPPPAPKPPAETRASPFGARGQILVLGGSEIGFSESSFSASSAGGESLTFSPDVDYFVAQNVSLGVAVNASYTDGKGYGADGSLVETQTTSLSGGVHLGFNIPFGRAFSWFPQLTFGYESTRQTESIVAGQSLSVAASPLGYPSTTQSGPYVDLYAPFLFHAFSQFFFGFGPEFFHNFGSADGGPAVGGQRTQIGAGFVVGAYWGGDHDSTPPSEAPSQDAVPHFGDQGEVVVTNSLVASINSLHYAGTDSSSLNVGFGGAVDWFMFHEVSLGVACNLSYAGASGIDGTTGRQTVYTTGKTTVAPRLGLNLPIGRSISVYPVLELGFGSVNYDETESGLENKGTSTLVALSLFAPVLVHPAPHVFVGFGPSVYTELSDSVSFPNVPQAPSIQNREVAYSAGLVIGGWL